MSHVRYGVNDFNGDAGHGKVTSAMRTSGFHRHHGHQVFGDFVEMAVISISKAVEPSQVERITNEVSVGSAQDGDLVGTD